MIGACVGVLRDLCPPQGQDFLLRFLLEMLLTSFLTKGTVWNAPRRTDVGVGWGGETEDEAAGCRVCTY